MADDRDLSSRMYDEFGYIPTLDGDTCPQCGMDSVNDLGTCTNPMCGLQVWDEPDEDPEERR